MSLKPRIKRLEKAVRIAERKSNPPRWVSVYKKDGKYFTHAPIYGEPDVEWVKPKDWRDDYDGIFLFTAEAYKWGR